MSFAPAVLDAMLKATGKPVVFSTGASTFGKFREANADATDGNGYSIAGRSHTLIIRDGVQPSTLAEDDALTVDAVSYLVADLGSANPDGTRTLALRPGG